MTEVCKIGMNKFGIYWTFSPLLIYLSHIVTICNNQFKIFNTHIYTHIYFGTALISSTQVYDEIIRRISCENSENFCYCSVRTLLSPRVLSKTLKISIYRVRQKHMTVFEIK
jgi:hypothetical protein